VRSTRPIGEAADGWIPLPSSAAALLLVLGGTLKIFEPLCILFGFYRRQAALLFILLRGSNSASVPQLLEFSL
jgi:uncharacterized membrane protein YphA (DoxX/SURF4 family)